MRTAPALIVALHIHAAHTASKTREAVSARPICSPRVLQG